MTASAEARVAAFDWRALAGELDWSGCAVLPKLLSSDECSTIAALYSDESHFRSHVYMARHGFGKGEYRYFDYPLPGLLSGLRTALYPHLASVANEWNGRMGIAEHYPDDHASFLERCHAAGQTRPTPLLLQYVPATTTASTRISTAISHSRSRSRFSSRSPAWTSQVASLS